MMPLCTAVDPAFDDHPCFISISPADTPYEGGGWCVKLILGTEYPAAPPRGYFMTKIFHPNIASNGGICVNALKKDWTQTMTLSHIFQVIRCLLIVPFPESSLNDEAGKLFMTSYDEYHRRAKLMTAVHAIPASKFPPSVKTGLSDGKCPPQSSLKARVNMADSSLGKIASESPGYQPTKKMKAKETKRKKALKRL